MVNTRRRARNRSTMLSRYLKAVPLRGTRPTYGLVELNRFSIQRRAEALASADTRDMLTRCALRRNANRSNPTRSRAGCRGADPAMRGYQFSNANTYSALPVCGWRTSGAIVRGTTPRAAAAQSGRHRDVLLAVDAERHGEPLDRSAQPRSATASCPCARRTRGSSGRGRRRTPGHPRSRAPPSGTASAARQSTPRASCSRRRPRACRCCRSSPASRRTCGRRPCPPTLRELDLPPGDLHARLRERNDEQARAGVIAGGVPVVPAFRARDTPPPTRRPSRR